MIKFQHSQLSNGFNVVTDYIPDAKAATVRWLLRAGARHEPFAGTGHFFEHLISSSETAENGSEICRRFDEISPGFNFSTSQEYIGAYADVKPAFVPEIIKTLGSAVSRPQWSQRIFEREKRRIVTEFYGNQDAPKRMLYLNSIAFGYAEHAMGRSVIGPVSNIEAMTEDHCFAYMDSFFKANHMALIVSGPVKHAEAERAAAETFGMIEPGDIPLPPPAPAYATGHVFCLEKPEHIQTVLITFPGFSGQHRLNNAVSYMNDLLSRKLAEQFTNAGVYSTATCTQTPYRDTGIQIISINARPDDVNTLLQAASEIFHDPDQWITETAFKTEKLMQETRIAFSYLNPSVRSGSIENAFDLTGKIKKYETIIAEEGSVTPDTIREAYNTLSAHSCNIVGWGPMLELPEPAILFPGRKTAEPKL